MIKQPVAICASSSSEAYSRFTARKILASLLILALLVVVALVATTIGGVDLGVGAVARSIVARIAPWSGLTVDPMADVIVGHLRLPRIVMGILAGGGLAIAGAAMQGALRNPLVCPFTIGVASGAALGASLAIIAGFGLIGMGRYVVMTNAFLFAMGTSLLILGVARLRGVTPESFLLVGIALMSFFGAATGLLQFVATEGELVAVVHWMFGSLTGSSWVNIATVAIVLLICIPIMIRYSWDLNAMACGGDEVSKSLGVNCGRVRTVSMLLASLIAASIITFTGLIAFVGLVAPHITRLLIGADHRFLLPASIAMGALLLVIADTIGRTIVSPVIIPVGIVISFVGAPFFFYLLMVRRREYWQ
ncbi:MAG: Hemin transport system permease protein HmuU [Chloroflexi bacterium]|nr:Hemin transport system permease protein HmuU [Chloroflexota bacterium]